MVRTLIILATVLLLATPALVSAKDMTGRFGLGYFGADTPIGCRYWVNDKIGVDLGVGFASQDLGDETATNFFFEVGLPYVVYPNERANFFVRPGAMVAIVDNRTAADPVMDTMTVDTDFYLYPIDDTWTVFNFTLSLGGEVYFGEHFSLEAAHGVLIYMASPPTTDYDDRESTTEFYSFGAGVSHLGFHFYFK